MLSLAPTLRMKLRQGACHAPEVGDTGGGTGGTARVRAGPAPGFRITAGAAVLLSVSEPGVRGRHVPASATSLPPIQRRIEPPAPAAFAKLAAQPTKH